MVLAASDFLLNPPPKKKSIYGIYIFYIIARGHVCLASVRFIVSKQAVR